MKITCLCHTCAKFHTLDFDPRVGPAAGFSDWLEKHPEPHNVDFLWPERSRKKVMPTEGWLSYLENSNVNVAYASSSTATIALASLATSSTLLVGRQSTAIDNTSNLYLDYFASGKLTTGTSPTSGTSILVSATTMLDDSTWPDAFGASDAGVTVTTADTYAQICQTLASIGMNSASSNTTYTFGQKSVAQLTGGSQPSKFVFFVVHNTGVNFNSTAGNFEIAYKGIYCTVV